MSLPFSDNTSSAANTGTRRACIGSRKRDAPVLFEHGDLTVEHDIDDAMHIVR
jgi:hypothetical protein